MAQIRTDKEVVQATAKLLLSLTSDPHDVQMTHGSHGIVYVVPDELAERFVRALQDEKSTPSPVASKKKGK